MTKYRWFLIFLFAIAWIWAAINPVYPHDWLLENYLVFIFILNWIFNKDHWKEIRQSFRIPKNDRPLGEQRLKEYLSR